MENFAVLSVLVIVIHLAAGLLAFTVHAVQNRIGERKVKKIMAERSDIV